MYFRRFKELIALGSSQLIGTAITSIFWLYIAREMNPEEYGEIFFHIGIATLASVFAVIGTQNTLAVYIAKRIPIQSTLFTASLIPGIISAIMIYLLYQRVDSTILVIAYVINALAMGELLGKKEFSSFSRYFFTQKIATVFLGLSFFHIFGVTGIIYALALSYVAFIIRIVIGYKETRVNFSLFKTRWGFITNNYFMSVAGALNSQIDKLIIPPLLGFTILGNYNLALQVISMLSIIPNIMFRYLLPHDASGSHTKKIKQLTFFISIPIAVFGFFVMPIIIDNFFTQYSEAISAVRIMSLSIIPWTVNLLYSSKFLAIEKSRHVLISYLLIIITLVIGMIILGPIFGISGVAVSQLIAQIFGMLFLLIIKRYSD